jgi:hypothetical protein
VNASKTTILGSTNGTVIRALTIRSPGKDLLYKRYAPGMARAKVKTVDTTACHSVNQIISSVFGSASVASQPPENPRDVTRTTGQ